MKEYQLRTLKRLASGQSYSEIARLEGVTYFAIDKRFRNMRLQNKCNTNAELIKKFRYEI